MKHPETQTCSVTYNKDMHQVSVEYVKGYGETSGDKKPPQVGQMDRQTESKPIVPSGETGRGLITFKPG